MVAPKRSAAREWTATFARTHEFSVDGAPTDPFSGVADVPWVWRAGGRAIVFDGLLQNERELQRVCETEARGAELLWHAYDRFGRRVMDRLRGAFVLVVAEGGSLFAGRDIHGNYPLFYADKGGAIVLSKSIDELARHPNISAELNVVALADHLAHRFPDAHETYYQHVRRIPPGHAMEVERANTRVFRYWNPLPEHGDVDWVGEDELPRFAELLDQAVSRCVTGSEAVFLSGGLDSISVAAVATDLARQRGVDPPLALSLVFPHPEVNEETTQRAIAKKLGLGLIILPYDEAAGGKGLLRPALDASRTWPLPMFNLWYPAYRSLGAHGSKAGARAGLTGTGGDEWLSVTPFYAGDLIRRLDIVNFVRLWGSFRRSYKLSSPMLAKRVLWTYGLRALLRQQAMRSAPGIMSRRARERLIAATPDWIAPDPAIRRQVHERAERLAAAQLAATASRPLYQVELQEALDHQLVAMEAEETFERSRRSRLRIIHPLCDPDLVDFLYRTPPELLNRGGRSKGLVRDTLAQRFPDLGFDRQRKVSATGFVRERLRAEGPVVWRELGGTSALAELGIVDPTRLDALMDRIVREEVPQVFRFWDILTVEVWARARM